MSSRLMTTTGKISVVDGAWQERARNLAVVERSALVPWGRDRGSLYVVVEAVGDPATGLPIGGTGDNLKASIAGETHEYTDMYPGMAKAARDEGFDEIADWFETLAKAERSHANRFQKALDNLGE